MGIGPANTNAEIRPSELCLQCLLAGVGAKICRCKHICCRDGLERPPKLVKKKPCLIKARATLKQPSLTNIGLDKRLPIEGAAVDFLTRLNSVKHNTRTNSSELVKCLKKSGIDFVDLANEELQQDYSNCETGKKDKPPAISRTQTRVTMANCQPRYTYESQAQQDLPTPMANRKAHEPDSEEEINLPPPGTLTARSTIVTASTHPLLFGSSHLYSLNLNDEDLDTDLAYMPEPTTISPQKNARSVNTTNNIGDIAVSIESSPPTQHKLHHNRETGPFLISSPESSRTQAVDFNDITEHGGANISNWDTSPGLYICTSMKVFLVKPHANNTAASAGFEPLPGRSAKRPRPHTPDSPLLNRSTRFKGVLAGDTQMPCYRDEKHATDEDLLVFLGDCVEFI